MKRKKQENQEIADFATADMPTILDNPSPAELEVMYEALRKAYKSGKPINWYRQWPTKYLIDALPMWWLIDCGLVKPDGGENESDCPRQCSIRQFADFVTKQFGVKVDPMKVSHALKSWLSPSREDKSGKKKANGLINRDVGLKLWSENVGGSKEEAKTLTEYKTEQARIDMEESQRRFDDYKKETDGKYGLVSTMKNAVLGLAAIVAGVLDKFIEDRDGVRKIVRETYLKCGATEEMVQTADAILAAELVTANDGIKKTFASEGEKSAKRFEAQRKEELKAK